MRATFASSLLPQITQISLRNRRNLWQKRAYATIQRLLVK
jgi:hypothetical protein